MQNGQKKLANTIQMENARLNRSMTDNSWSERRDLIDQVRKTQDIVVRGMSNNHDNLKLLFDNTVSNSLKNFLIKNVYDFNIQKKIFMNFVFIRQYEDISRKLR